jgi:hypothetical protein
MHDELDLDTAVPFVALGVKDDIDCRDAGEVMGVGTFAPDNGSHDATCEVELEPEVFVVAAHRLCRDDAAIACQQDCRMIAVPTRLELREFVDEVQTYGIVRHLAVDV